MADTTEESLVQFILGGEPTEEAAEEETEAAPQQDATDEETGEAAPSEETEAEQEDVAEAEGPDVPEQPDLYTVKVNGVEKQVTLEELKRDYSGNQYVQQRMQDAAAKVKEAEAFAQTLAQERQAVLALAQQLSAQGVMPPPKLPDPKLAETDPVKYMKERARFDAEAMKWQQQQAQIAALQSRQVELTQAERQQRLAENAERLKAEIPEFADPQKSEALRRDLLKFGKDYGYSETELLSVDDARAIKVLHKAMQWDRLQAQKAQPVQPGAPKTVKPKAVRPEPKQLAEQKALQRAAKSQKAEDWTAYLFNQS